GKRVALSFPNIAGGELMIGKSLIIGRLFHRRGIESKVRSLQRLLNIYFKDLNRIGRGNRVDKTLLWPACHERIVIELDEETRHWQVELQAILGIARQHLVWVE